MYETKEDETRGRCALMRWTSCKRLLFSTAASVSSFRACDFSTLVCPPRHEHRVAFFSFLPHSREHLGLE